MEIRPVRPEEYSELADLTVSAYDAVDHVDSDYEVSLRDVAGRVAGAEVLVAVDDRGLLGGITFVPDHASPYAEFDSEHAVGIRMLAVQPEAQGQGVGRALIEECIERARRVGRHEIILHTGVEMVAAHRLYESLGFQRDTNLDWWATPSVELLGFRLKLES